MASSAPGVVPELVSGAGAIVGLVLGGLAAAAAALLPRRYGVRRELSPRRPLRDAVLVIASALVGAGIGHVLGGADGLTLPHAGLLLTVNATAAAGVLAGAAIDLEHRILPSEITLGGALLCLLTSPLRSIGWRSAILGLVLGAFLLWVLQLGFRKLRPAAGAALGLGDVKLAAFAGAWHGVEGAFLVLLLGGLQAIVAAGILRLFGLRLPVPESVREELAELRARRAGGDPAAAPTLAADPMEGALDEDGEHPAATRLPLGLFLALGCIEVLFLRRSLVALFFG
jgi:leader peptidase (prepilin peptidase) / N-methyltransferase